MLRCKAVTALLFTALCVSGSCGESPLPTTPTTTVTPPLPPPPPTITEFAGPGTYIYVGPATQIPYAQGSSFVLGADGTFVLRLPTWENGGQWLPAWDYRGKYAESAGQISFDFDWNNVKAGATAVFHGDDMTVTYGRYMSMADFPNGIYRLAR